MFLPLHPFESEGIFKPELIPRTKKITEDKVTRLPLHLCHVEEDFHKPLQKLRAEPEVKVHIIEASITSREMNISLPPLVT